MESISYGVRGNTTYVDVADIAPFFRLPSIRSISTLGYVASKTTLWPEMPGLSTVRHLDFSHAVIEGKMLENIFRSAHELETLHYNHFALFFPHRTPFHPATFAGALRTVKNTLRELKVTANSDERVNMLYRSQNIGCLQDFCQLRIFNASLEGLLFPDKKGARLLVDVLPSSIRQLEITDFASEWFRSHFHDLISQLIHVIDKKATRVPLLNRISALYAHVYPSLDELNKTLFMKFIDRAAGAAVELIELSWDAESLSYPRLQLTRDDRS